MEIIIILIIALLIIGINLWVFCYKRIRNFGIKQEAYKDMDALKRELETDEYSPAMISYLWNQKVEVQKDVIATLVNLCAKKFIKLKKQPDGKYDFMILKEGQGLPPEEFYVYESLVCKAYEFNVKNWTELIKTEYDMNCFSQPKEKASSKKIVKYGLIGYVLFILLTMLFLKFKMNANTLDIVCFSFLFTALYLFIFVAILIFIWSSYDKVKQSNLFLSQKGKEEIRKWYKFKRFIEQYTLLKQRKMEEVELFEKYIPYAIAVNVNKKYIQEMLEFLNVQQIKEIIKYKIHHININTDILDEFGK